MYNPQFTPYLCLISQISFQLFFPVINHFRRSPPLPQSSILMPPPSAPPQPTITIDVVHFVKHHPYPHRINHHSNNTTTCAFIFFTTHKLKFLVNHHLLFANLLICSFKISILEGTEGFENDKKMIEI